MLGARGATVPVPVEEEPPTPSDDASAPGEAFCCIFMQEYWATRKVLGFKV